MKKLLFLFFLFVGIQAYSQTTPKVTTEVTLEGSATDEDGTIVKTLWTQESGPGTPKIENPDSLITKVTGFAVAGVYIFKLTVWDDSGATGSDTTKVTVLPANVPPRAKAMGEIIIKLPTK